MTKRAGGATPGATTRERSERGLVKSEREGAFGNAVITAEVCYSPVTKHGVNPSRPPSIAAH